MLYWSIAWRQLTGVKVKQPPSAIRVPPPTSSTMTWPWLVRATETSIPSARMPAYMASADFTKWLIVPVVPSMFRETTSPATSPATLIVSLPRPPMTRVSTPGCVLSTSIVSSPSSASTSSTSTFA